MKEGGGGGGGRKRGELEVENGCDTSLVTVLEELLLTLENIAARFPRTPPAPQLREQPKGNAFTPQSRTTIRKQSWGRMSFFCN